MSREKGGEGEGEKRGKEGEKWREGVCPFTLI